MKRKRKVFAGILGVMLIFVSSLIFFSTLWYSAEFGETGFDSILFTLFSEKGGVATSMVWSFVKITLLPTLLITILALILFIRLKRQRWVMAVIALVLCISSFVYAAYVVNLPQYLADYANASQLFETEYVDPAETAITFPEEKRNLIYIMLESVETTFFSKAEGGALEENVMPELYDLAVENVNFSHNDGVGGCQHSNGATWTTGAVVANTAGVPFKMPPELTNRYNFEVSMLPGLTTIVEVLKENGYNVTFMCGSNATFGALAQYYTLHGADNIVDYYSAINEGYIMPGFFEWWGLADSDLYNFAKTKLEELGSQDEPFAFTLATIDTHGPEGYICSLCIEDYYEERYENVMACASYQLYDFLDWLSWQDFYENTTIVIVGDHLSMSNDYMKRALGEDDDTYVRRLYNCFINSAVEPENAKNRVFTQFDLFPTTLAAMGATIEGERLALGTNLFSDVPTLAERMGFNELDRELSRASEMYRDQFMMPVNKQ